MGCWAVALRDRACARREAQRKMELSRFALGEGWIASNARSGPIPLPLPLKRRAGLGIGQQAYRVT